MSELDFKVIDLDFPVGSKNKTATLVAGEREALLVDAGFTRADGHRLVAEVRDSGRTLSALFVSHADPDYYWGAEVVADAFPQARLLATAPVIESITKNFEGKLRAWEAVGSNRPTRLVSLTPLTGELELEGHRFELRGGHAGIPDRHYLWQPDACTIVGGVLAFSDEHVWVADTPNAEQLAAWQLTLEEMAGLQPDLVIPGHRLPGAPADASAITYTREYLSFFQHAAERASDAAELKQRLIERYPNAGMVIAAEIGSKVVKGEMQWG